MKLHSAKSTKYSFQPLATLVTQSVYPSDLIFTEISVAINQSTSTKHLPLIALELELKCYCAFYKTLHRKGIEFCFMKAIDKLPFQRISVFMRTVFIWRQLWKIATRSGVGWTIRCFCKFLNGLFNRSLGVSFSMFWSDVLYTNMKQSPPIWSCQNFQSKSIKMISVSAILYKNVFRHFTCSFITIFFSLGISQYDLNSWLKFFYRIQFSFINRLHALPKKEV